MPAARRECKWTLFPLSAGPMFGRWGSGSQPFSLATSQTILPTARPKHPTPELRLRPASEETQAYPSLPHFSAPSTANYINSGPVVIMSNEAGGQDDLVPEQTEGFKVGEKKTIDEYQKLGKFPKQYHSRAIPSEFLPRG